MFDFLLTLCLTRNEQGLCQNFPLESPEAKHFVSYCNDSVFIFKPLIILNEGHTSGKINLRDSHPPWAIFTQTRIRKSILSHSRMSSFSIR